MEENLWRINSLPACPCHFPNASAAPVGFCNSSSPAFCFKTLFFKFTGAAESVYIFTKLGVEPWGRIASGLVELLAVILLLTPRTVVFGALLSLGVIVGAIASHLTRLGIVVQDDGGLLFGLAVIVLAGSLAILTIRRCQIPILGYLFGALPGSCQCIEHEDQTRAADHERRPT